MSLVCQRSELPSASRLMNKGFQDRLHLVKKVNTSIDCQVDVSFPEGELDLELNIIINSHSDSHGWLK